jgi:hypothetical protein
MQRDRLLVTEMVKEAKPDLKELFRQAAAIASQVPENMQEAAFNRALDLLTVETPLDRSADPTAQPRKRPKKVPAHTESITQDSLAGQLLSEIDSTQHPEVKSAAKVLDRSLAVLQIARTHHSVDGLTPADIATILTEKFRIGTTKAAISMALGQATALVNRTPQGQGFLYRIMGPGEEYLTRLNDPESSAETSSSGTAKPAKKQMARKAATSEAANSQKTAPRRKK